MHYMLRSQEKPTPESQTGILFFNSPVAVHQRPTGLCGPPLSAGCSPWAGPASAEPGPDPGSEKPSTRRTATNTAAFSGNRGFIVIDHHQGIQPLVLPTAAPWPGLSVIRTGRPWCFALQPPIRCRSPVLAAARGELSSARPRPAPEKSIPNVRIPDSCRLPTPSGSSGADGQTDCSVCRGRKKRRSIRSVIPAIRPTPVRRRPVVKRHHRSWGDANTAPPFLEPKI